MKERGERELAKKSPFFRRELVEAKVKLLFPDKAPAEILQLLDEYDSDFGEGTARIQLAILKLSDGDIEKLRYHIAAAKRDYRDVILPAENPELLRVGVGSWARMSEDEKEQLSNKDVQQYLGWLEGVQKIV